MIGGWDASPFRPPPIRFNGIYQTRKLRVIFKVNLEIVINNNLYKKNEFLKKSNKGRRKGLKGGANGVLWGGGLFRLKKE